MSKFYLKVLSLLFFLLIQDNLYSQEILNSKNLKDIKIDQLSDVEISRYYDQVKGKGLSEDQAAQIALASGLPIVELSKLRQRLAALNVKPAETNKRSSETSDIPVQAATAQASPLDPKIFGAELFGSSSASFQPNVKIATPVNYVLGPDDQLQISVYGLQEVAFNLTISPEGTIYVPNVGQINVSGLSVEAATSRIRSRMSSIYTSLRSGASKMSITLGNIRSIRITILGSAKPGTYTISSLSTLFNALYLSGGPSINGSFREIELLRDGSVTRVVDLYKFLLTGSQADNIRLRENDVVRIPIYKKRVEIEGEVRRPGIFELIGNENASDLINFANGFTDSAYRASVKIYQVTPTERRIKDLTFEEFIKYVPQPADFFEVSKILNIIRNRVSIQGAVLRGGNFELTPGLTVGELINKAFLREDAYTERGQIVRTRPDLSQEIIPFDVRSAVNGLSLLPLQRE
ncbi:MAG: polysialic acid transport protein, partial [Segetibacter sp.]|nr:polysialic acid transport protein [Segetibacter sp.]